MSEEDTNLSQDVGETETSSEQEDSQQNNTSTASESETTQKTGRTAQDRIRELVAENKRLKESTADKPSTASQGVPADKVLAAKVDFLYKAPEHLKPRADEIATYQAQYGIPMEDAIAIFDSKGKVSQADVEAAQAANTEAAQSRTGGTANPAARIEPSDDVSKWSNEELDAEFERRLASGEKF